MNITSKKLSTIIFTFFCMYLGSMQYTPTSLTIQTLDCSILTWQLPILMKYSNHLQEIGDHAHLDILFNLAELNALILVLSEYDKNPTHDHLKSVLGQFLDDSMFPLSEDFIWFRLMDYFKVPFLYKPLIELIVDRIEQRTDIGLADTTSQNQSWKKFSFNIKTKLGLIKAELMYTLIHEGWISSVAISPDCSFIVTGSYDNTAKIWDARTGELLNTLKSYLRSQIESVTISSDSTFIVIGLSNNSAEIWDTQSGNFVDCLRSCGGGLFNSVAISSDNSFIALNSYNQDNAADIWNRKTGKIHTLRGHQNAINSVAISSDTLFIVTGSDDATAKIWNALTGNLIHTLSGHQDRIKSVVISPDNSFIVTGSFDNTAKIWSLKTDEPIHTLSGHQDRLWSIAISPDSSFIVTGSEDKTAKIWNSQTGQLMHTLSGHQERITSIAINSDSSFIVTGSKDGTAKIWNARTGKLIHTLSDHRISSVAISSDSSFIVTGSWNNTAKIWAVVADRVVDCLV